MGFCRVVAVTFLLLGTLSSCQIADVGLELSPGWSYHSLGAWKTIMPNRLALAEDGRWLYFGSEASEYNATAAVVTLNVQNGHSHVLIQGLSNVNGIHFAPDGSLWTAEGGSSGLIWRMADPSHFPDNQRVDRASRESTYPGFASFRFTGRFDHRAMEFSTDGRYAYLADAGKKGGLYRLDIPARKLAVFVHNKGWLQVTPEDAVINARQSGADAFQSISDIERLPDGTLLLAESGAGRILMLDDRADKPLVKPWVQRDKLAHPDDMSWDASRHWLWITDAATPSTLWAWDGHTLHRIVRHQRSRISGVFVAAGKVYVSVQRGRNNPSMIFTLQEQKTR